ncbi:hypothetical protein [Caudoviricetes sp.]|nr:hypothetical protein [Caudoviricetes sp.]
MTLCTLSDIAKALNVTHTTICNYRDKKILGTPDQYRQRKRGSPLALYDLEKVMHSVELYKQKNSINTQLCPSSGHYDTLSIAKFLGISIANAHKYKQDGKFGGVVGYRPRHKGAAIELYDIVAVKNNFAGNGTGVTLISKMLPVYALDTVKNRQKRKKYSKTTTVSLRYDDDLNLILLSR